MRRAVPASVQQPVGLGSNPEQADDAYLGERLVAVVGLDGAAALLDVLTRSEDERVRAIGRLSVRADTAALAEALMQIGSSAEDRTRQRFIRALERAVDDRAGAATGPR
jgi:hypothetical protein